MIHWNSLENEAQLYQLEKASYSIPFIILKHSPRCDLSNLTKGLLEQLWVYPSSNVSFYLLNVLQHRSISNLVSEEFNEYHQSPQLLLISKGECIYVADYPEIVSEELCNEVISEIQFATDSNTKRPTT